MSHNFSLCDIYWGLQNYKNISTYDFKMQIFYIQFLPFCILKEYLYQWITLIAE